MISARFEREDTAPASRPGAARQSALLDTRRCGRRSAVGRQQDADEAVPGAAVGAVVEGVAEGVAEVVLQELADAFGAGFLVAAGAVGAPRLRRAAVKALALW